MSTSPVPTATAATAASAVSSQTSAKAGSYKIPEAQNHIPPSSEATMDDAVQTVASHKEAWHSLAISERVRLLDNLLQATREVAQRWVEAACKAKGIAIDHPCAGEEWIAGPAVLARNIRLLAQSLRDIDKHGVPRLPGPVTTRAGGQVVASVFPTDVWDKLTFMGFRAEVWMQPEVKAGTLRDHMAEFYRQPSSPSEAKVALVLGAGNVSSIGPMDTLYKMFVEGQVTVLKMNPVNAYLGPIIDELFTELRELGYFRVVYGGAKEGEYLCTHALVDEIHITGSDKTHDAIVWGLGEEGDARKEKGTPRNTRRVTSELGNVSPIIVVPGPWSAKEIAFHGVSLASSLTNNAGFNCNATRAIITHASWDLRSELQNSIKRAFEKAEQRAPYYPGAESRHSTFMAAHPDAHQYGAKGDGRVPWTFITDVDSSNPEDICFTTEAWCGVTCETSIAADTVVDYIRKAVEFANDTLWGTLSCSLIVHPKSLQQPGVKEAVEQAIADLRFGSVVLNHWSALSYAFASTTWGAFPGHTPEDVRSGIGVVHNTYLFDKPQKTVIRAPFMVLPRPAWFNDHKTGHELGPAFTEFNAAPSLGKLPRVLWSAIRG